MVKVSDNPVVDRPGDQSAAEWIAAMPRSPGAEERARLTAAWEYAAAHYGDDRRAAGDRRFDHAVAVADILSSLELDADTVIAGLLHDLPDAGGPDLAAIAGQAGATVASLVEGGLRMGQVSRLHAGSGSAQEGKRAEALRKMLLAMARDIRVVFLVLAERLHDLRLLGALPEAERQQVARETLDLHAPLANRLGIWQIKWELEDLSFRYLDPDSYKRIARLLAERRVDRERFIEAMKARLGTHLAEAGLNAEISGRPKHIYSIWRKMQRKGLGFDELFDLRAVRVLVDTVPACYTALGIIHSLWQPIPREFDDYIASPKENDYRSLHTAVMGEGGRPVEVQIRTREMHDQAELGIAAHWRYKEGRSADPDFDARVAWLRQLLESTPDSETDGDLIDRFRAEIFEDRVYVITPGGDVVDLPRGTTPLDFAYTIHSEIGHHCRGARVNGRMVPLTHSLQNGDQVEILTARHARPSRDWLNPALGYLNSPRSRAKVRAWFRQQDQDKTIQLGRELLERELHRLGLADVNLESLAARSRYARLPDFLAALGRGDVTGGQIAHLLRDRLLPAEPESREQLLRRRSGSASTPTDPEDDISVYGVGNLMTRMARCCQPTPGDAILGFITRNEGVTVHRSDCANIRRLQETTPERLIEVSWSRGSGRAYPVDIVVEAYDRPGLIRDISSLLNNEGINVTAVNTRTDPDDQVARMVMTVEVADVDQLSGVMQRMVGLRNIRDVHRAV
ncbi:GTP diphosphokinase [Spiribacter aquaticus]|jgi:GTP pyrophosphokinase|uniref:GTP pyrophosphokinase n=2 Tax=Spiribacter TaxID=1335745 RepID=A0A557RHK1_9GAMM|nr:MULTISPECIES: GTP diphosphokinase [Spiribacter]KAF0280626.1 GTP diphosphokinase [Spiribacter roseus]PZA00284.1 GTP diphosphokinase [Gammaproteobacteria bacterium 2W06]TVO64625.1 GTP diphosphokinase [Spiribacter aquaticus]